MQNMNLSSAVERTWHTYDSLGQILALAFRPKTQNLQVVSILLGIGIGGGSGDTTPCKMIGRGCVQSRGSSYTGLYPQRRSAPSVSVQHRGPAASPWFSSHALCLSLARSLSLSLHIFINIYIYTYIYIHTYKYIYIFT